MQIDTWIIINSNKDKWFMPRTLHAACCTPHTAREPHSNANRNAKFCMQTRFWVGLSGAEAGGKGFPLMCEQSNQNKTAPHNKNCSSKQTQQTMRDTHKGKCVGRFLHFRLTVANLIRELEASFRKGSLWKFVGVDFVLHCQLMQMQMQMLLCDLCA